MWNSPNKFLFFDEEDFKTSKDNETHLAESGQSNTETHGTHVSTSILTPTTNLSEFSFTGRTFPRAETHGTHVSTSILTPTTNLSEFSFTGRTFPRAETHGTHVSTSILTPTTNLSEFSFTGRTFPRAEVTSAECMFPGYATGSAQSIRAPEPIESRAALTGCTRPILGAPPGCRSSNILPMYRQHHWITTSQLEDETGSHSGLTYAQSATAISSARLQLQPVQMPTFTKRQFTDACTFGRPVRTPTPVHQSVLRQPLHQVFPKQPEQLLYPLQSQEPISATQSELSELQRLQFEAQGARPRSSTVSASRLRLSDVDTLLGFSPPMQCNFCKRNGERRSFYSTHNLQVHGRVTCPILQRYVCPLCGATGESAHTVSYCPLGSGASSVAAIRTVRKACGCKRVCKHGEDNQH